MTRRFRFQPLVILGVIVVTLVSLTPIIWVVLTSLKTRNEIYSFPPTFLPASFNLENFINILVNSSYGRYAVNSLIVGFVATFMVMMLAILSSYAYSKFFNFKGKNSMMIFIIIARMVPEIAIVIPLFLMMQSARLYDTLWSVILPLTALAYPMATWLLKTFFDDVPISLIEAARIDGASTLGILFRIVLPISGPALASTFTITFLTVWNSFLIPQVFTKTVHSKTLTVGIAELANSEFGVNWGGLSAIAVVTVLPVFIIGFFAQKYLTAGLTAGAEKG